MDYAKRIHRLQQRLRRLKLDALLVSDPFNRRYLSGFSAPDHGIGESSGQLLIPASGEIHLLTDFRYVLQAERDVPWARLAIYPKGLLDLLAGLLPRLGIGRLAIESDYTLLSRHGAMTKRLGRGQIELVPTSGLIEKMRVIKDEDEIELIRRSVRLNEEVFTTVLPTISPGQTEIDIALALEGTMRRLGAEGASFPSIVASAANSALPHAVPTSAAIAANQPLTIDMGLILEGYCSDMTRTFVPGQADQRYLELHRLVRKAQLAGMAAVRAGVTGREVDAAARDIIAEAGYGANFGHSLGHGVGLAVHEMPRISKRSSQKLQAGMIITIEPGIYIPGWGGIRLENMLVVRENGSENLNSNTTWLDL